MLMRLFPVFFVASVCAATFIVSFILFYLHAGPRLLLGQPQSLPYLPLIDFESKGLKFIDLSDSFIDKLVQTHQNNSRKSSNNEVEQVLRRLRENGVFVQPQTRNGASDQILDFEEKTRLESPQDDNIKHLFNPSRAKHFEMLKPKSVGAMYIDHQRNKKLVNTVLEKESDWVFRTSLGGLPIKVQDNKNFPGRKVEAGAAWELEQGHRRERIKRTCAKNDHMKHHHVDTLVQNRQLLTNFLVDDEHKLIYCYVPKVACTQWKRVFITLLGKSGARRPEDIPHMMVHYKSGIPVLGSQQYTDDGIRFRLNSYTKFVFSRHPFERVLSAYRDKFESNSLEAKVFSRLYGHAMIRALADPGRTDYTLSFTDMLRYLSKVPATTFQEHWKPIYNLCHPCSIDYTFIGSFDELATDSTNILNRTANLGAKRPTFPSVVQSGTPKLVLKYLAKVPLNVTMNARKVYQMDFDMFGYK